MAGRSEQREDCNVCSQKPGKIWWSTEVYDINHILLTQRNGYNVIKTARDLVEKPAKWMVNKLYSEL